jgi:(hydroxyamino)benzene mutase
MSESLQALLCFTGVLLFLLGMVGGFGIPAFRSPRIGLSAHLAGIESGLALIAIGLVGARIALPDAWAAPIAQTLWLSLYALWIGLIFAAVFGAGASLPIAGGGMRAKKWQEHVALVLILGGSVGSAGAVAALLFHWSWRAV